MINETFNETPENLNLIDGKKIISLNDLSSGEIDDDRTEEEQFYEWTQQGCPTPSEEDSEGIFLDDMKFIDNMSLKEWLNQNR
jgi:hypothetical protein